MQLHESEEETCKGLLYLNAHVLVTLESQDLWLICILHLHSPDFKNFQSTFEIKVDMNLQGNELRTHIQKIVITMWNNLCLQNTKENTERSSSNLFDDNRQKQQLFVLTQLDVFRFEKMLQKISNSTNGVSILAQEMLLENEQATRMIYKQVQIDNFSTVN